MSEQTFGIGIPTYNRLDLLIPALHYYAIDFKATNIVVFDNGHQDVPVEVPGKKLTVLSSTVGNIGVAAAWNILCRSIFTVHSHALILNDDIYLGAKAFQIDGLINQHSFDFYTTPLDWCAFILPRATWEKVGEFDECFFPAYCEDVDYHRRMKLRRMSYYQTPVLLPKVHRVSQTFEKAPQEFQRANYNSKKYYKEKWGGHQGGETFIHPFGKIPDAKR